ncbi:MAG TPA: TIGR03557 family F420-dependent LLM class oxidoreductase [Candidatus Binatia bacterium]|nr:TIGR03557 family F420-dependent LLM class oxidoreductase [Candidatus Binatia bacterium]
MVEVGYKLSSEEFGPVALVEYAAQAERSGFEFALISDHFHPWSDRQGQSPFVWSVIGAIGAATERLRIGTGVTCPTMRIHPAIVAQAAATTAALMPGRFFLGVGTGENLNEHIVGRGWPSAEVRLEMLEEAIQVIRLLWEGGTKSHRGRHFTVQDARLYTLPKELPQLMVAASKPLAAELAGRVGDAIVNTEPDEELLQRFRAAGGRRKPCYVELTVCWAEDERRARRTAHEIWALSALGGPLFTELAQPSHFEAAFKPITEDQVAEAVVCGPDPKRHLEAIEEAAGKGYTHVCVHQVGPEQEGFLDFYESEILPRLGGRRSAGTRAASGRTGGGRRRGLSAAR